MSRIITPEPLGSNSNPLDPIPRPLRSSMVAKYLHFLQSKSPFVIICFKGVARKYIRGGGQTNISLRSFIFCKRAKFPPPPISHWGPAPSPPPAIPLLCLLSHLVIILQFFTHLYFVLPFRTCWLVSWFECASKIRWTLISVLLLGQEKVYVF